MISRDTTHGHTLALLRRSIAEEARISVEDVTQGLALLCVRGPRARDTLAAGAAALSPRSTDRTSEASAAAVGGAGPPHRGATVPPPLGSRAGHRAPRAAFRR
ncbi:MAG: hypothetical protein LC679_04085 [Intrasporangiaceae bacterium]|nr:hypothetical protein [Intrasporangiaceae bacterium]